MPRMCLCLVSIFHCCIGFELLTPKVQRRYQKVQEKSVFKEKPILNGKNFKNCAVEHSPAHRFTYSCQVSWKSVKRSDQIGVWYSSRKRLVFCPPLWLLQQSCPKFYKTTLSLFPIPPNPHLSAKFCPNASSFRADISENVFQKPVASCGQKQPAMRDQFLKFLQQILQNALPFQLTFFPTTNDSWDWALTT